jgi:hypothetical protein
MFTKRILSSRSIYASKGKCKGDTEGGRAEKVREERGNLEGVE